jgi:Kelch motif
MNDPHWWGTATTLLDGRVLVAAGGGVSGPQKSCELFDPVTRTWTYTGRLHAARLLQTATLLADGRVLVSGGQDYLNNSIRTAEVWDPATGAWTVVGRMHTPRNRHTAALLPDGRVLVAG